MTKDFELNVDINTDNKTEACDKSSDFNGDLAKDNGLDLNSYEELNPELSKTDTGKRFVAGAAALGATIFAPLAPIKDEYIDGGNNVPAIHQEYTNDVKTPEQIAAEMGATIQDGDPVPDTRGIEEQAPRNPEYGEHDD